MKQMSGKRILGLVLAFVMMLNLCPVTAQAASSGVCGENLTWSVDSGGTLTISGSGPMRDFTLYDWTETSAPWDAYYRSVKKVVIEDGVTSIGYGAFYFCASLTSI